MLDGVGWMGNKATGRLRPVAFKESPVGPHPRQTPRERLEYPVVHRHNPAVKTSGERWRNPVSEYPCLGVIGHGVTAPCSVPRLFIPSTSRSW
jgi:hypothetical protein